MFFLYSKIKRFQVFLFSRFFFLFIIFFKGKMKRHTFNKKYCHSPVRSISTPEILFFLFSFLENQIPIIINNIKNNTSQYANLSLILSSEYFIFGEITIRISLNEMRYIWVLYILTENKLSYFLFHFYFYNFKIFFFKFFFYNLFNFF